MEPRHGKLTELNSDLGQDPIDVLICSASYEKRCRCIVDNLDLSRVHNAVIAINERFREVVKPEYDYLAERLGQKGVGLVLDSNEPLTSADNIAKVVGDLLKPSQRFLIDITAFTRESLLMLVRFLKLHLKPADRVDFVYTHAKEYSVDDKPEDKWLSKGIHDIRSVLGFPGELLPSRKSHLIILVGFEDERALSLIRQCEPLRISLGVADESEEGTEQHQETNVHRFARLKSILDRVEEFRFKGYDAEATADVLQEQIAKFPDLNTLIAPMNTKISTLGAALLAIRDPTIQLCYAQPNTYNYEKYSVPHDDYYLFQLMGFP